MKPLQVFCRDRSGNVAIMAAIFAPILLYILALGVDYGLLTLQDRKLQQTADLSAIIAASDVTKAQANVLAYFQQNNLNMAVLTSNGYVSNNGTFALGDPTTASKFDGVATITTGTYTPTPSVAPSARFVAGATPPDAAKVAIQQTGGLYFASAFSQPPNLSASGTASTQKVAAFSIGSRLLSLNNGVVNALLNSLLGTNLSLSVMDYQSLASVDVNALSVVDTLATNLNLTAGSYSDTLNTQISYSDLLTALINQTGLSPSVSGLLRSIQNSANTTQIKLNLNSLLSLGPLGQRAIGSGSHLSLQANLMDLISAAALAANGSKQVSVNLAGTIPGLSTVQLTLAIGQPAQQTPSLAVGAPGTVVRTVQTRMKLVVAIDGLQGLLGLKLQVPLYIELASAQGTLSSITCLGNGPQNANVTIATLPGVADLYIGDVDTTKLSDFTQKPTVTPSTILNSLLVQVIASSHVAITNQNATPLVFSPTDISSGTYKSTSTTDILTSAITSLLANTTYTIKILIITIGTQSTLQQALSATLASITSPLDTLLSSLLMTVGVKIGDADVRVTDVRCQQPVLVQ